MDERRVGLDGGESAAEEGTLEADETLRLIPGEVMERSWKGDGEVMRVLKMPGFSEMRSTIRKGEEGTGRGSYSESAMDEAAAPPTGAKAWQTV